jgi:hypothetical protein
LGEREVAYVLEEAYDAGVQDASGGEPGVYRVLVKAPNSEDWYPLYNKSGTEFYATVAGAKQRIAWSEKRRRYYREDPGPAEYKIQGSPLRWEDLK